MWRLLGAVTASAVMLVATPARAVITSIGGDTANSPGGSVISADITPGDPTSAFLNLGFSSIAPIDVVIDVTDASPIATYGSAVNETRFAWAGFSISVVSGAATFLAPNDPNDPYGTFSDMRGWSVALTNQGSMATFSGGSIDPGASLDQFIGLSVTGAPASVTLAFTPVLIPAVPEPSSAALCIAGLALLVGRRLSRFRITCAPPLLATVATLAVVPVCSAAPQVVAAYQAQLAMQLVGTVAGSPTQMSFGPDGRLYVMTPDRGPISFAYDATSGSISDPVSAAPQVHGLGIAFQGPNMYLSALDGSIHKLSDANGNGVWGEPGELDVSIVTGIPQGDHNTDQLQVVGNTLYVGIGRRTINGHSGAWTGQVIDDFGGTGFALGGLGRTWGDSAYNGTISWIQDLSTVADATGSANAWSTNPPVLSRALVQQDAGPFTLQAASRLVVHSAGTRNPFGLCLDGRGALFFTNNFNRTVTLGNGDAGFGLRGDRLDSDFSRDVQDQFFQAVAGGDYGYTDVNWRGVNPMLSPGSAQYHRVRGVTFDNSFNPGPYVLHNPAAPDGLGPSSSADGCAFWSASGLPAPLRANAFVARFNGTVTEAAGGAGASLTYADLVAVDVATGTVRQVASGFANPLAVLVDPAGRLLVADYGSRQIYALHVTAP